MRPNEFRVGTGKRCFLNLGSVSSLPFPYLLKVLDEHEVELRAGYDLVAEGLGLTPDEDAVRLDDSNLAG